MKNSASKILLGSLIVATFFSCHKNEISGEYAADSAVPISKDFAESVSDSVSSVATMQVKDKQFIKTADVNMEVKDVYEATISIEKNLEDLGGFVTSSNLSSRIVSEENFNTSDENATLVRKFQTENSMQVRVPTEKLGVFLTLINDKKVFLNSRVILAEDVTSNIKLAELEAKRNAKTGENIDKLKADKDKVKLSDENIGEGNHQKVAGFEMTDQLKYSTVDIYLKEPNVRIAEIPVVNSKSIDKKYKFNFIYDLKNAFVEGFYLIQKLTVGLVSIWPLIAMGGIAFWIFKKRKSAVKLEKQDVS